LGVNLAVYDNYAGRGRIGAGVAIKRKQATTIFNRGLSSAKIKTGGVLEIGPGDGYIAELSRLAELDYLAIEGSDGVADKLRSSGFKVIRGYVPPMPAEVNSGYRCCFMLHVLEHMKSYSEAAQIVSEIRNTLAPGGAIVVACPDYSRWGHYFYDCDYTHAYPITRRRLSQLLVDQGFEVVQHTVYTGPVFGYIGLPISWLAKLLYWPLLDDLIGPTRFKDVLNRGYLTFLPNILTIARRPMA
jgi:SAM-dependent methyltransferase